MVKQVGKTIFSATQFAQCQTLNEVNAHKMEYYE